MRKSYIYISSGNAVRLGLPHNGYFHYSSQNGVGGYISEKEPKGNQYNYKPEDEDKARGKRGDINIQEYGTNFHRQVERSVLSCPLPVNTNTPIQSLAPGIHQGYSMGIDPYKHDGNSLGFMSIPSGYGKTEMLRQMYGRGVFSTEMNDSYIANKYSMQLAAYKSILDYGTSGNFELAKSESTKYEKLLLIL